MSNFLPFCAQSGQNSNAFATLSAIGVKANLSLCFQPCLLYQNRRKNPLVHKGLIKLQCSYLMQMILEPVLVSDVPFFWKTF